MMHIAIAVMKASGDRYITLYERTQLTDQLHELFGFRTDYKINMIKKTKKFKPF
ncbi:hypothetical protein [Paraliobacillus sp. JSM ZJ581]|uniref:hypothetical protein n=1 Tax=Paraliobacillus sp. JSM ZJ581 TaxID=3342118 RepID=UPI0035A8198E